MKFQLRRCGAAILAILTVGGIAAVGGMLLRNAGKKLVSASSAAAIPASTGNWGLSFQTEGASPVGNGAIGPIQRLLFGRHDEEGNLLDL